MVEIQNNTPQRPRGIYILPNLFTVSALFAGFYSIVAAMKGVFDIAAISIFLAMVFDGLDGRVARITHTQTAFGAELDSLSDMVSFGIAPALVAYNWVLFSLGKIGWLVAFVYAVAVALRLARFNTQVGKADKRYFQGLPCPPAAGAVAGMVWVGNALVLNQTWHPIVIGLVLLMLSVFMVSNIRYRSFKDLDLKNNVSFLTILTIILVLVLITIEPALILFAVFFLYAISAPFFNVLQIRRRTSSKATIKFRD